jgi:hypothetical protein
VRRAGLSVSPLNLRLSTAYIVCGSMVKSEGLEVYSIDPVTIRLPIDKEVDCQQIAVLMLENIEKTGGVVVVLVMVVDYEKTPENPPHCHDPLMVCLSKGSKQSKASIMMFFFSISKRSELVR